VLGEASKSHVQTVCEGGLPAASGKLSRWLCAAIIVSCIVLGASYKLVIGKAAPHWDGEDFFAPAFTFVADHARHGRFMLWNPLVSGGSPDFAEPELGAASPVTIAFGAIFGGTERGYRVYWLCVWLFGPIGVLFLARHLGAPLWGGFIVSLAWAFSGFCTGHSEHMSSLYAFSFVPWIIWRLDRALRVRRIMYAAEAGLLWGLSALGGYPQLTILTGLFLFLWSLGASCFCDAAPANTCDRPSTDGGGWRNLAFACCALTVFLIIGVIVLSPTYFAYFTETFGYSDRVGPRPRDLALTSQALDWGALSTFSSPYLSMLKLDGVQLWPMTDVSMSSIYIGGPVFILAIASIASQARSRWRWWLAFIAAFFLLCALGDQTPLRGWVYDLIIPTRYFRNPALFRAYAMMCGVILATLGTRDIADALRLRRANIMRRLLTVATVCSSGALICYISIFHHTHYRGHDFLRASVLFTVVWGGTIAVILIARGTERRKYLPVLLMVLAIFDGLLTFRLTQREVFDTGEARTRWNRINSMHKSTIDLGPRGFDRALYPPEWLGPQHIARNNRNVPLRVSTFVNYAAMSNILQEDFSVRPTLATMSTGPDRIWFADTVAELPPSRDVYPQFVARTEQLNGPITVIHTPKQMAHIYRETGVMTQAELAPVLQLPAAELADSTVLSYTPNELRVRVNCPRAGWLLVTERWAPGWKAYMNGAPTEVYGGNFIYRAVKVPPGANELYFQYSPRYWRSLLALSWATMGVLLAWRTIVWGYLKRR
jgi:hypothetical protein